MTDLSERVANLSADKRELLRLRLEQRQRAAEPIAVIGIGCRFPQASDPEAFWELLANGRHTASKVPPDRWDVDAYLDPDPSAPGKMYTPFGCFLDSIDQFDPQAFGISRREAMGMDPQQRLLLEVSAEALENAGLVPEDLVGSATGVFVGACFDDYSRLSINSGDVDRIDSYTLTGNIFSVASGRISYTFGFEGPNVQIDTACSASLVAVHLACQSLRSGESTMALAGGVNVMLSPEVTIAFCKLRALAPDGRCKTFDAAGDGYVRGEGCGILVLKRLTAALADDDNIVAVIRGSAVNQDGRSNGLTAPNGSAQEGVVRAALASAQIQPADVGYVEAHGTGTSLGDPIEALALGAVLGAGRPDDRPFAMGSVKTNIGHLEGAAGAAGLIKLILSLQHEQIPPHLHLTEVNPRIHLDELRATIPTELVPWSAVDGRRIGGVSSFGVSGTNAHVVVEQAPELPA